MIIIPLYTLLIIYAIFLFVFFTFFTINVWHIFFTGTNTFNSFVVTFIVVALSIITLFGTWYFLQGTNWQQPLITLNIQSITGLFQSGGGEYF